MSQFLLLLPVPRSLFPNLTDKLGKRCKISEYLVDAIENKTLRQEVKFLSCLTWKGIIKEQGLFGEYKAWCPQCFEQWRRRKKAIYEPLIWSFKDVNVCPQHHCPLVDYCPSCGTHLRMIANSLRNGFCYRCKAWLGSNQSNNQALSIDNFEVSLLNVTAIGYLMSVNHLIVPSILPDLRKKLYLINVCLSTVVSSPDFTHFSLINEMRDKLRITLNQDDNEPLSLTEVLLPVCRCAKISLSQLLILDFQALSDTVFKNLEVNL